MARDFSFFAVFFGGAEAFLLVLIGMKTTWIGAGVASGFWFILHAPRENKQNRPWHSLDTGPSSWSDIKASDAAFVEHLLATTCN
jgi:hypothetical protein